MQTMPKNLNISKFQEMDIRAGVVRSVKKVDKSDKLLILSVDIGEKEISIVSGIGKEYKEKDIVGLTVAVIVNLDARDILGIRSEGMILSADGEKGPVLLTTEKDVPPGKRIK